MIFGTAPVSRINVIVRKVCFEEISVIRYKCISFCFNLFQLHSQVTVHGKSYILDSLTSALFDWDTFYVRYIWETSCIVKQDGQNYTKPELALFLIQTWSTYFHISSG